MARFGRSTEDDLRNVLKDKNAPNTDCSTQVSWNIFNAYLKETSSSVDPQTITKEELNELLKNFYVDARKTNGEYYKKKSLMTIRFGIQRKFHEIRPQFDLIKDPEFSTANEILKAQGVFLKTQGLAKTDHKVPICKEDMVRLYSSGVFSLDTPLSLQRKVFFEILLHLCRRGQENLNSLTKDYFSMNTGADGREYVIKIRDELEKNHRTGETTKNGGIMVATGTHTCPVRSFKMYTEKLHPKCDTFFQRPKKTVLTSNAVWYDNQVIGVNMLGKMMKNISKDAQLSVAYTNHCVRATCVTLLDAAGYEARDIMAISGHRSESSIRSYSRTDMGKKRQMSTELSTFCGESSTITKKVHENDVDEHSPTTSRDVVNNPSRVQGQGQSSSITSIIDQNLQSLTSFVGGSDNKVEFSNCSFVFNN